MKDKLKMILKILIAWVISFLIIYLFVFLGGFRLLESDDVILQEIGVSFVVGLVITFVCELFMSNRIRIEELEKRIEALEKENQKSDENE